MENIIFGLAIGVILGIIIGYLLYKDQINKLKIKLLSTVSQEDLADKYIMKGFYDDLKTNFDKQSDQIGEQHKTILALTNERISKDDVEKNYKPAEAYNLMEERVKRLEENARTNENTINSLNRQLTEFQQKEKYLDEKLRTFTTELENLHKSSHDKFKSLATEVLEEKKQTFIGENKKELDTILGPLKTNLTDFKKTVEDTRKEDIKDLTSLKNEIESLHKLNTQLSDDAQNLATALKSEVKMQGNWGEDRLNMILEVEGLQKYIDFSREEMYRDNEQEKNRKPDFILNLPNGKHIVIDSKVSLTAYVNYYNAPTAEEKVEYLKQHLRSVTDHVNNLADKNYQSLAGLSTPDYVFMFMPIESALTLAINQNPEIFNNALKRKIILITPTTLVATLKIVKMLWQKENQVKNVEEIFRQCGELYNKFVSFLDEMDRVETALNTASKAHRAAMDDLKDGTKKGNTIIGRFETIKKLEAKTNKQIPDKYLAEIDLLPDDDEIIVLDTGTTKGLETEQ